MEKLTFKKWILFLGIPVALFITVLLFSAEFNHDPIAFCYDRTGMGECLNWNFQSMATSLVLYCITGGVIGLILSGLFYIITSVVIQSTKKIKRKLR